MAIVTGDRYLERLVKFVEQQAGPLIEGTLVLKLNPVGLHYVQSRLEALNELESLLAGAPVDYLRAYVSDLGDHRALEQLRRILRLLTSLKVVSVLQPPARDPTPLSLLPFGRLRVLELRGCDLSTSAAKGLLELRHTLEKIICHNSTDALRHIFASRIAEIKVSPQWKRLSFVSCACNGLVLMDESLQLLPAVETLDLSRNKFAKVDNLRKCAKLKHLDLGFNQLRAISSFSEVSCHIVKLVLRNNALTTFRGIENLKSLEGLDVSYNIISNFSELEFLSGLQFLQNLWLEGNPICCARWYRPQVFSYFSYPEKLKLDDKEISTREIWKRQLIIARRQRRPASFGFYSPAKCDATGEGSIHRKRKKVTRLASIEGEEESSYLNSDEESVSIDNEIQSREEAVVSDNEAEIVDLMNRVELMKKERSILWLREFKEWMDHTSENFVDHTKCCTAMLDPGRENLIKKKPSQRHYWESSRYASDSVQASGDESSTNVLESDNSFIDTTAGLHAEQYFERTGLVGNTGGVGPASMCKMDLKEDYLKAYSYERISSVSAQSKSSRADTFVSQGGHRIADNLSISPLTTIDDISESHSSSAYPGSPPHYQEDILHRRHYLEEEILQLSAESYSIASSDSNTSCSEDDICGFMPSTSGTDQAMNGEYSNNFAEGPYLKNFEGNCYGQRHQISHIRENGQCATNFYVDHIFGMQKLTNPDHSMHSHNDIPAGTCDDVNKEDDLFDERKSRRKTKRRVISLIDDNISAGKAETSQKTNGNHDFHVAEGEQEQPSESIFGNDFQKDIDGKYILTSKIRTPRNEDALGSPGAKCLSLRCDDFIKNYFNTNVADSKSHEICIQYMRCYCVLEQAFQSREREVALILSSKQKMYVLLAGGAGDEPGTTLSLLGCHRVEDIREVFVGVGLQVVRVCIERSATYLFITRDVEKSRQLLCSLQDFDSFGANDKCCLRSLEQVQVELFEKQIYGGLKVSIFQYSMVLFWYNNHEEGSWVSRSLFVVGVHLLMCIEDFIRFGSLSEDASSPPYYSLDSCCAITDISEMVVEAKESCCVTVQLECATSVFNPSAKFGKGVKGLDDKKTASSCLAWKLKWFSEESLFKFVALVKAIHSGTSTSPLLIRCIS